MRSGFLGVTSWRCTKLGTTKVFCSGRRIDLDRQTEDCGWSEGYNLAFEWPHQRNKNKVHGFIRCDAICSNN